MRGDNLKVQWIVPQSDFAEYSGDLLEEHIMKKKPDRILPPDNFDYISTKETITIIMAAVSLIILVVGLIYIGVVN